MKLFTAITIGLLTVSSLLANRSYQKMSTAQPQQVVAQQTQTKSDFDKAVDIIKKYETLHKASHWPFVGYGHKVLPGEKYKRGQVLSEKEADALLRKDLRKNCAVFRSYGADSLLLGVLAYNIGPGAASRSAVAKKLKSGNRDIYESYIAHSKYRGKVHKQIRKRRIEEFNTLFVKSTKKSGAAKTAVKPSEPVRQMSADALATYIYGPQPQPRAELRQAPDCHGKMALNMASLEVATLSSKPQKNTQKKARRDSDPNNKISCIPHSANGTQLA